MAPGKAEVCTDLFGSLMHLTISLFDLKFLSAFEMSYTNDSATYCQLFAGGSTQQGLAGVNSQVTAAIFK